LVGEVVVQHAVGELGVLRDVAQAGVRVPLLGQGQQRGVGELVAPLGELVYLTAGDPLASQLSYLSHFGSSGGQRTRGDFIRQSSSKLLTTVKQRATVLARRWPGASTRQATAASPTRISGGRAGGRQGGEYRAQRGAR